MTAELLRWLWRSDQPSTELTMRRWLFWTLFAGVMGFFVGGSFVAPYRRRFRLTVQLAKQRKRIRVSRSKAGRPAREWRGVPVDPVPTRLRRNHLRQVGLGGAKRLRLPHQLRQLGDIRRDPPHANLS